MVLGSRTGCKKQANAAGERYRPDLQVDLPIEEDLRALACSSATLRQFERLLDNVASAGRRMHLDPSGSRRLKALHREVVKSAKALLDTCDHVVVTADVDSTFLEPVATSISRFLARVEEAARHEHTLKQSGTSCLVTLRTERRESLQ